MQTTAVSARDVHPSPRSRVAGPPLLIEFVPAPNQSAPRESSETSLAKLWQL